MAKYILLALNGAMPDSDPAELERWYEEVHMPDLKTVPGIKSARRFKTIGGLIPGQELWPHVAVYEIETDDLAAVSQGMQNQLRSFHPALDRAKSAHIFAVQTAGDD